MPFRPCATGFSTAKWAPKRTRTPIATNAIATLRRGRRSFAGRRSRHRPGAEGVVGTYRLIRREAAAKIGQFYSADEYDIGNIERIPAGFMELGRSCVDAGYRNRAVMQLLWGGIAAYVFHYKIDLMFGCASLPRIDPDALAAELSYLYYYHLAPPALRPRALPHRYIEMRRLDRDEIDPKRALASLPPLIKGYLRLGGFVGDGAVIDAQFNTTDVAVVVKTDMVTDPITAIMNGGFATRRTEA